MSTHAQSLTTDAGQRVRFCDLAGQYGWPAKSTRHSSPGADARVCLAKRADRTLTLTINDTARTYVRTKTR